MKNQSATPLSLTLAFACAAIGLAPAVHAATPLISDDFESYSPVDNDLDSYATSPWNTSQTGAGRTVNVVSSPSSFAGASTATQAVRYEDTDTASGSNANIAYTFASTVTTGMTIQFDFKLNSTSGYPTLQLLDSANTAGLFLNLTRNSAQPAIVNQTNGGGGTTITNVDLSTWYRVTIQLDAPSAALETYAITVESGDGAATPLNFSSSTNYSFRNNVIDYNRINIFNNTTGAGTSDFHIDNFSITAVPEPSAALLGCLGLMALVRRRRA